MLKFLIFSYLVSIGVVPVDLHLIATTIFLLVVIAISGVDTRPVLRCYWPTIALTMIASFVTIYYSVFDYNTMKGFGYCLLPVVYAMAGFIISNADDDQESLANIFIISSAAVSLYYIYQYYSLGNVDAESRFYIRSTIGKGFAICPVGLALAIYLASTNIDAYKKALYAVVMPIIAYGIYISESRTGIIGIIIILVSIFKIIQQKMLTMLSIPAIVLLFIFTTPAISVIFSDPTYALRHLPLGLQEVISIDYLTERDVTGHWRGFETFRAYQFMEKSGIIAWVIGTGLHRTVPINILRTWKILLGGHELDSIPIFHNGFSFIVVRAGAIGLVLFAVQIVKLCKMSGLTSQRPGWRHSLFGSLALAMVALMIVSTPTTAGLYNPGEEGAIAGIIFGIAIRFASLPARSNGPLFRAKLLEDESPGFAETSRHVARGSQQGLLSVTPVL